MAYADSLIGEIIDSAENPLQVRSLLSSLLCIIIVFNFRERSGGLLVTILGRF